jgi:hypothetical protein
MAKQAKIVEQQPKTTEPETEVSEVVQQAIALFEKDKGRLPTLSPEQIEDVLDTHASESGEISPSALIEAMIAAEQETAEEKEAENTPPVSSGEYQERLNLISAAATKLDNSAEFKAEIAANVEANDRKYVGPVQSCLILQSIFTQEEMNALPDVGTTAEKVKGTNRPYDVFVAPPKPGKMKGEKTSVWDGIALSTAEGKSLQSRFDALEKALKKTEGYEKAIWEKYKQQPAIEAEVKAARSRLNYYKDQIKNARKVWERIRDINSIPKLNAKIWCDDANGKKIVRRLREPLCVFSDGWEEFANLSFATFNQLKPGERKADTFSALMATASRESEPPVSKVSEIKDVKQYELHLAVEAAFAKDSKKDAAFGKRVAAAVKNKEADFILTFGDVVMFYDQYWGEVEALYRHFSKNRDKIEGIGKKADAA